MYNGIKYLQYDGTKVPVVVQSYNLADRPMLFMDVGGSSVEMTVPQLELFIADLQQQLDHMKSRAGS